MKQEKLQESVTDALQSYDKFVDDMWFYDPAEHQDCPELAYTTLKLAGEAGEVSEKVGKYYRDRVLNVDALVLELGDMLFYIVKLAHIHDKTLEDVAFMNRVKLLCRMDRGTLKGSGDDR